MATLNATLDRLHLTSPQPAVLADFYGRTYQMTVAEADGVWSCTAPDRRVLVSAGEPNQLLFSAFRFADLDAWNRFGDKVASLQRVPSPPAATVDDDAILLHDPDGNLLVFEGPRFAPARGPHDGVAAQLQHYAVRTQRVQEMLQFYERQLGFVVSDRVVDDTGTLRACFLRVDALHHTLALFAAPTTGFDHQSFETEDWASLKFWADRVGRERQTIVWGIGRHGPGDDVFFMVRDPDGNLAEVSAELERCSESRPAGQWPHEERTLNLWGKAILRS